MTIISNVPTALSSTGKSQKHKKEKRLIHKHIAGRTAKWRSHDQSINTGIYSGATKAATSSKVPEARPM